MEQLALRKLKVCQENRPLDTHYGGVIREDHIDIARTVWKVYEVLNIFFG